MTETLERPTGARPAADDESTAAGKWRRAALTGVVLPWPLVVCEDPSCYRPPAVRFGGRDLCRTHESAARCVWSRCREPHTGGPDLLCRAHRDVTAARQAAADEIAEEVALIGPHRSPAAVAEALGYTSPPSLAQYLSRYGHGELAIKFRLWIKNDGRAES